MRLGTALVPRAIDAMHGCPQYVNLRGVKVRIRLAHDPVDPMHERRAAPGSGRIEKALNTGIDLVEHLAQLKVTPAVVDDDRRTHGDLPCPTRWVTSLTIGSHRMVWRDRPAGEGRAWVLPHARRADRRC